jgi:hypothetical protein
MNQRLSDSEAAPAVYKAMLALQASVNTSGLEKEVKLQRVCKKEVGQTGPFEFS